MSDGSNAAKGLPGYKKTLTQGFYPELFNTGPAAPPAAGIPWTTRYEDSPLIEDPPTPPPPTPDRYIRSMSRCAACGAAILSGDTGCSECGQPIAAMTTGLTTPGTPWF
jgi:hypothetical protein